MSGRSGRRLLSLKDLRVTKLDKKVLVAPCAEEFEAYLNALQWVGGDDEKVSKLIMKKLHKCMEQKADASKPASVNFHLAKFVKR